MTQKIIVTGGAGFMGSHMVDYLLEHYPEYKVVCVDKLSYTSHYLMGNLKRAQSYPNFEFVRLDLANDYEQLESLLLDESDGPVSAVFNFAAETSVDRSFEQPRYYVRNNVLAMLNLLECCRELCRRKNAVSPSFNFIHISTDEVYGPQLREAADENAHLCPSNPYSATKGACDLLVNSYIHSFKLPVTIIRPNNVYGPRQYPEKLVAVTLEALLHAKPNEELPEEHRIPIHGDGTYTRRYLHVSDFVRAVESVWTHISKERVQKESANGEVFNVGTDDEIRNIDFVKMISSIYIREKYGVEADISRLVRFTRDRDYNDARYATDLAKIRQLGWTSETELEQGIRDLVRESL